MKWTLKKLQKEALKYNTRNEFKKNSCGAYSYACRKSFLNEVCSHMKELHHKWTLEDLQQEALKYSSKIEFKNKNNTMYSYSLRKDFLNQICSHMKELHHKWSAEEIKNEALKYKSRKEFEKNSRNAYNSALSKDILDQVCSHMISLKHRWTVEELQQEALKYKTRLEFQQKTPKAYGSAKNRKILDQVCSHMPLYTTISRLEKELINIVKEKYPKAQKLMDRKVKIENKPHIQRFELDIYVPELRKGIEFDGEYHHSFKGLKRGRPNWPDEDIQNYHKIKDEYFLSKGIKILHINELEWKENKSQSLNKVLEFLRN